MCVSVCVGHTSSCRVRVVGHVCFLVQVPPLEHVQPQDDKVLRDVHALLQFWPDAIAYYLSHKVLPIVTRSKPEKLSACGQELGTSLLFGVRLGCVCCKRVASGAVFVFTFQTFACVVPGTSFTGTPSSLLPMELGTPQMEKGSQGKIISVLTDPEVLSVCIKSTLVKSFASCEADDAMASGAWPATDLLKFVATANPPFRALIDTGALITGMSNQEARVHGLFRVPRPAPATSKTRSCGLGACDCTDWRDRCLTSSAAVVLHRWQSSCSKRVCHTQTRVFSWTSLIASASWCVAMRRPCHCTKLAFPCPVDLSSMIRCVVDHGAVCVWMRCCHGTFRWPRVVQLRVPCARVSCRYLSDLFLPPVPDPPHRNRHQARCQRPRSHHHRQGHDAA